LIFLILILDFFNGVQNAMALHAQIYLPIALVVGRLYAAAMVIFLTNPAFVPAFILSDLSLGEH
jgi:hypothetical protein